MMDHSKWQKFSIAMQLGNVGSAFSRAIKTKNYDEVLELLDLTIADKRWTARLAELTRLREVMCDFMTGSKNYKINGSVLNEYFVAFGIAARSKR